MTDIVKRLRLPTQEFRGLHAEAADVIERQRQQLEDYAHANIADRQEIARLEMKLGGYKTAHDQAEQELAKEIEKRWEGNRVASEEARQELAACQAHNRTLRELLPKVLPNDFISFGKYYAEAPAKFMNESDPMSKFKGRYLAECDAALAQPFDDTTLRAALAAERKRVEAVLIQLDDEFDTYTVSDCLDAIRALENA